MDEIEYESTTTKSQLTLKGSDREDGIFQRTEDLVKMLFEEPVKSDFNNWTFVGACISIGGFIANLVSDFLVVKVMYERNNQSWFQLTLFFLIVPLFVINIFSFYWYWHDHHDHETTKTCSFKPKEYYSTTHWQLLIAAHILQLGLTVRYVDKVIYGYQGKKLEKKKYRRYEETEQMESFNKKFTDEERDISMLQLMQGFLQDTPELILQLYILASSSKEEASIPQIASIIISLLSLSWAVSSYQRALRMATPNKRNLSFGSGFIQFLWRLGTITCRIICLALFAIQFKSYLFVLISFHWCIMFIWIYSQKTDFCNDCFDQPQFWKECFFDVVMATVAITCFVNVKDEPTRLKIPLYYALNFSENSVMIILWYLHSDPTVWYHLPAVIFVFSSFVFGILFMILYYQFFHPQRPLPDFNKPAKFC